MAYKMDHNVHHLIAFELFSTDGSIAVFCKTYHTNLRVHRLLQRHHMKRITTSLLPLYSVQAMQLHEKRAACHVLTVHSRHAEEVDVVTLGLQ